MNKERRKEPREHIEGGVLYLHESGRVGETALHGLASDMSGSGACIYAQQCYGEGEEIKVFSHKLGDKPIRATIKWCRKLDDGLYKIGLAFDAMKE